MEEKVFVSQVPATKVLYDNPKTLVASKKNILISCFHIHRSAGVTLFQVGEVLVFPCISLSET